MQATDQILSQQAGDAGFTFVDLFAGIGGTRLGFELAGGTCVFTCEWDKFARQTYEANFSSNHEIAGDIRLVSEYQVPDHDVLIAGFPCQPFSMAGVSKKKSLGRPHGFDCPTQGTLFYDVKRILESKQPAAFLLENVRHLIRHDHGRTFETIMRVLQKELGYQVHYTVASARPFVPQGRDRTLIVGFREKVNFDWAGMKVPDIHPRMRAILHPEDGSERAETPYTFGPLGQVNDRYILSDKLWSYLQQYAERHRLRGNGFGFGLVTGDGVSRTLSARYYKDGAEILVDRGQELNPRRLTPRECARLMGFPPNFIIPVSDNQAYKQFGNSVVVPLIEAAAQLMVPCIQAIKQREHGKPAPVALRYGR